MGWTFLNYVYPNPPNLKRIVSIFFLAVFLFNVGGYYLIFWGMQRQARLDLLHQLDADQYASSETIILTIPLTLPYPVFQDGFQRVNGEFEYQGEFYKLVKQKLENDVLHVVCIKDTKAKNIDQILVDYSKLANDIPSGTKQSQNFLAKLFKDYQTTEVCTSARENILLSEIEFHDVAPTLVSNSFSINAPPPEVVS
ncbi:MAG: hypothetical protein JNM57_10465 [Cyclobacteriaceae bacterium]|nr:hypothetical protein [Cyclobacteriaceae bacterium]